MLAVAARDLGEAVVVARDDGAVAAGGAIEDRGDARVLGEEARDLGDRERLQHLRKLFQPHAGRGLEALERSTP